jgi:cytosine/adenosine deaminase-related metal-dependent hydrolase
VVDLGSAAIVPGLVNAHTHLEFSDVSAPLGEPGLPLPDWISRVMAHRRATSEGLADDQTRRRSKDVLARGLDECIRGGATTIGDIAGSDWPEDLSLNRQATVCVFLELIGLAPSRIAPLESLAREHILSSRRPGWQRAGISPHAPYTVHRDLLAGICRLSQHLRFPVAMHVAESREELQLLDSRSGDFVGLLESLDAWHPESIARGSRPLDYLRILSRADRGLVIHGNYLSTREIQFLSEHRQRMSVVYCPRTHAYFRHAEYPLLDMLTAGARVALGTDSRASNPDLSMWEEMRWLVQNRPDVAPATVLRMGTTAGAEALGLAESAATLRPGSQADFVVLELPDEKASDPFSLLFDPRTRPIASFRHGVEQRACLIDDSE